MPVSRPIAIALGGALLALVVFFASSVMRGGEQTSAPPAEPAKSSAPTAAKPEGAKPKGAKPEGTRPARPSPAKRNAPKGGKPAAARPAAGGMPDRVARAVKRGRTVVLFFYQRGGADDSATAGAVARVRGRRGVAVFSAPVSAVGDFRSVTGNLGLSQAPALVIVGKKGKARVLEGFVDPETLAQEVADSR